MILKETPSITSKATSPKTDRLWSSYHMLHSEFSGSLEWVSLIQLAWISLIQCLLPLYMRKILSFLAITTTFSRQTSPVLGFIIHILMQSPFFQIFILLNFCMLLSDWLEWYIFFIFKVWRLQRSWVDSFWQLFQRNWYGLEKQT